MQSFFQPFRSLRLFGKVIFAISMAWIILVFGLSWMYLQRLTHTDCPPGLSVVPGFQSILLPSEEGIDLPAWWHLTKNNAVVILLGGHRSNRDNMLEEAQYLARHGFGVLLPASRGCSGASSSLGILETRDLDAALLFLHKEAPTVWIGAAGFSAGGAAVIRQSVSRPEIQAVAAIGNYANLWREIRGNNPAPLTLEWQFQHAIGAILWLQFGHPPAVISPIDDLPRLAPRPVLLIHGEREIARTQGYDQFTAARKPKELFVVEGADHGEYLQSAPKEYLQKILEFFETSRGNSK